LTLDADSTRQPYASFNVYRQTSSHVRRPFLIIAYTMLKTGNTYHDLGGNYLEQTNKEHLQNYFVKHLRRLG